MVSIDNSIDVDKVVTWQYDNASHVCGIVDFIKAFFDEAVGQVWNGLIEDLDISVEDVSDYSLSVWGRLLGIPRPTVTVDGVEVPLLKEAYRRILLAHVRYYSSDSTPAAMQIYLKTINGEDWVSGMSVGLDSSDEHDMSISYFYAGIPSTEVQKHVLALFQSSFAEQVLFVYPTGVGNGVGYTGKFFSIKRTSGGNDITNFNPAEKGCFHWRER